MISSLLHLIVGLRPRVYYTLTNFRGGGPRPPWPPPQYANACSSVARGQLPLDPARRGRQNPAKDYFKISIVVFDWELDRARESYGWLTML